MSAIRPRACTLALATFALFFVRAPAAFADDRAEDLFVGGRDAMLRGDLATGCPLLDESYRREPRLGVLFTLAECEAQWGKASRAYTHYGDFLRDYAKGETPPSPTNDERQRIASSKQRALARKIALVTIVVPSERVDAVRVSLDGHEIPREALARELAVEPGEARFELTSATAPPQQVRVVVAAGERRTVTFTTTAVTVAGAPPVPAAAPPTVQPVTFAPTSSSRAPRAPLPPWAFATGATALVGLGVGAVTGAMVLGKKQTIDAHCVDHRCDAEGLSEVDRARTLGTVSSVAFAVGAVATVVTVVLVVVRPSRAAAVGSVSLRIGASPANAAAVVYGTW